MDLLDCVFIILIEMQTPTFKQHKHWQTDLAHSLRSFKAVKDYFKLDYDYDENYASLIPLDFAQKIKQAGRESPLWKQFIPTPEENHPEGFSDPIGDVKNARGSGIIQKYKSRVLFTPTSSCPVACRYCFRKNQLNNHDSIFKQNVRNLKNYLIEHPEINEVILTGGDPLILNNNNLQKLFEILSFMKIKFLRIHTRTPIILPNRINQGLVDILKNFEQKFQKIIFVLHTNHALELDHDVVKALDKLRDIKLKKLTQSVLLSQVNDRHEILLELFYKILDLDFTPYYLHHPDKARGAMHFYLPLEQGRKIYNQLRNELPGWAIPHYIIDHPDGVGKQLAFNPESYKFSGHLIDKTGQRRPYEISQH